MQTKPRPESNQDAFNNVWQHFVVERRAPGYSQGDCLYRTDDGAEGCAIGCQLPDRLAAQAEQQRESVIGSVLVSVRKIRKWFAGVDEKFLTRLQVAHDCAAEDASTRKTFAEQRKTFRRTLEANLRQVAIDFHLTIPEPAA